MHRDETRAQNLTPTVVMERCMPRLKSGKVVISLALGGLLGATVAAQPAARGRALTIEDYYRVQTVAAPSIAPNGRWVAFTVSTRVEDDNSTRTETFVVPSDASAAPTRVVHYGKDVMSPRSEERRVGKE